MYTTVIIALNLCYRCKHVSVGALLIIKHLSYPILTSYLQEDWTTDFLVDTSSLVVILITDPLTLGERLVFRHLPWVFRRENLEFTAVNEWNPAFCGRFPVFSETVNNAESRKIACIPAFTDRLPLGKLRVIPTFASSFLAFSFIFRDSEFK